MAAAPSLATLALGINALALHGSYLYYTNTDTGTFSRISVDISTGAATGTAELLADNAFPDVIFDDFTIDELGNAQVASGAARRSCCAVSWGDVLAPVRSIEVVAGTVNDTEVAGHTAVEFGTSAVDLERGSLYATTSGGVVGYITGSYTAGGDVGEV